MKTIFVFLSALASLPAFAASAPDCWTVDGRKIGVNAQGVEIEDGQWLVGLSTERATKEEVLRFLAGFNKQNIQADRYPLVFDGSIWVHVGAVDSGVGRNRLSRAALKQAVAEQLAEVLSIPGVSAECNHISHPARGGGVGIPMAKLKSSKGGEPAHFRNVIEFP